MAKGIMNRRASIAPLVTSYEDAIRKNRDHGFDRDILGNKSTRSSPYRPEAVARRASEIVSHPGRNHGEFSEFKVPALRRITMVDAMTAFAPRSSNFHGSQKVSFAAPPKATEVEWKTSDTPRVEVEATPEETRPQSPNPAESPTPVNDVESEPQKKQPETPRKIAAKDVPLTQEELKQDQEIQALMARIHGLEADLEKVERQQSSQLAQIEMDKKGQMDRFYRRQDSKRNLAMCQGLALYRSSMDRQAQKQSQLIQQLRRENKRLRQQTRVMMTGIRELVHHNDRLRMDQHITQKYHCKLEEFYDTEEDVHQHYSNFLPQCYSKLMEMDAEAERRAGYIETEQRILSNYLAVEEQIVALVQDKCDDVDLVDAVVQLSLGSTY